MILAHIQSNANLVYGRAIIDLGLALQRIILVFVVYDPAMHQIKLFLLLAESRLFQHILDRSID